MNQTIHYVHHEAHRSPMLMADLYQVRTDRPMVWLQKLCAKIMARLGAHHIGETVEVKRIDIEPAHFMERLFRQKRGIEDFFGHRPSRLLIGSDDYAELMATAPPEIRIEFMGTYMHDRRPFGLTVEIIPWMRGMVVMP